MNDSNLADPELILAVDNDPEATSREREMATRMQRLLEGDESMEGYQRGLI